MPRRARNGNYADILDQSGNVVGRIDKSGKLFGLNESREYIPWGSIGGDIWEFFHPEQVQREYQTGTGTIGQEPPSRIDIMTGAAEDATQRAAENIQQGAQAIGDAVPQIGKWIVIGLVAYAIIQVMQVVPKGRK